MLTIYDSILNLYFAIKKYFITDIPLSPASDIIKNKEVIALKVYFLKNVNIFPVLPVLMILAFVRLDKMIFPKCGISKWNSKRYFVIGFYKRYLGIKFSWMRV